MRDVIALLVALAIMVAASAVAIWILTIPLAVEVGAILATVIGGIIGLCCLPVMFRIMK